MFAVIKTGGKQHMVREGDILEVEKLDAENGQKVTFNQVLLIDDGGKTLIGTPFVENAEVRGEILEIFKDEKILVFKKKRRKQYKRTRGHRQELARVRIEEIMSGVQAPPAEKKATPEDKPEKETTAAEKPKREVKPKGVKEEKTEPDKEIKTERKTSSPKKKTGTPKKKKTGKEKRPAGEAAEREKAAPGKKRAKARE